MDFTKKIKENASKYGCLPFWSWNDKLEEQELRAQIQNMKDISMSGFFMHARGGLLTEYCSEDWYNCVWRPGLMMKTDGPAVLPAESC